mmetsp:Transcript_8109/g.12256  ORF Transcript_8109/g.12256 Transcript_8109/m.12256 type:complete len:222 (-) Transcript_8109:166-831(-)
MHMCNPEHHDAAHQDLLSAEVSETKAAGKRLPYGVLINAKGRGICRRIPKGDVHQRPRLAGAVRLAPMQHSAVVERGVPRLQQRRRSSSTFQEGVRVSLETPVNHLRVRAGKKAGGAHLEGDVLQRHEGGEQATAGRIKVDRLRRGTRLGDHCPQLPELCPRTAGQCLEAGAQGALAPAQQLLHRLQDWRVERQLQVPPRQSCTLLSGPGRLHFREAVRQD